jgi:hypothetical protein
VAAADAPAPTKKGKSAKAKKTAAKPAKKRAA